MKKLPTYMLTRKLDMETDTAKTAFKLKTGASVAAKPAAPARSRTEKVFHKMLAKDTSLASVFSKLDSHFQRALVDTFVERESRGQRGRGKLGPFVRAGGNSVLGELARSKKVHRVGVLDMGVWMGGLPMLLEKLNVVQPLFTMFEIQAPVPGGLIKTPAGMVDWVTANGRRLTKQEKKEMDRQIIANEFFVVGENIRKNMGLDLLIGLSPAMVATFKPEEGPLWNYFAEVSGKVILLSTADIRDFATKAGRPFEAGVGALIVPALLTAVNSKLGYHDDSGCLFDFNGERSTLADTFKTMFIEQSCLDRMTPVQRTAANAMVKVLQSMRLRKK